VDPALDAIVSPDAKIEMLADGLALTEGPVWFGEGQQGYLLFSDNAGNVIYKREPGKPIAAFLEKASPEPTTRRLGPRQSQAAWRFF
jgi:gluconolactonase